MGVSLQKGGNVSLSKEAPGITSVSIGLGWDARETDGADFDLDASLLLLNDSGKVRNDQDFIFYNNLRSTDGSIEHTGDNLTGEGDGDDESINVSLDQVPRDVVKLLVAVTIHDGAKRKQNFGQVTNAFMRIVNRNGGEEIARYDLTEDFGTEVAVVFGEVYRHGGEWKFRAVGQGYSGGLHALASNHGVSVS